MRELLLRGVGLTALLVMAACGGPVDESMAPELGEPGAGAPHVQGRCAPAVSHRVRLHWQDLLPERRVLTARRAG